MCGQISFVPRTTSSSLTLFTTLFTLHQELFSIKKNKIEMKGAFFKLFLEIAYEGALVQEPLAIDTKPCQLTPIHDKEIGKINQEPILGRHYRVSGLGPLEKIGKVQSAKPSFFGQLLLHLPSGGFQVCRNQFLLPQPNGCGSSYSHVINSPSSPSKGQASQGNFISKKLSIDVASYRTNADANGIPMSLSFFLSRFMGSCNMCMSQCIVYLS